MYPAEGESQAGIPGAAFLPTPWTVVLAARQDSATRRAALERLCHTYWPPVYHYIRRRGVSQHDAEDLTQGFFARVLTTDFLEQPDPERGRFRGYLVGALKRFLSDEFERSHAQKRGGGATFLEWNSQQAEDELAALGAATTDPATAYEKSWALTLLGRALARLEAEQDTAARRHTFASLKSCLTEDPAPGEYARLAAQLGITRAAVALAVHRLNRRYAELVRLEVADTVANPADVRAEVEHLLQALRA